jgi:hypothetical protein
MMQRSKAPTPAWRLALAAAPMLLALGGCETGFGEPCELPQTEEFRSACKPPEVGEEQDDNGGVVSQVKSSCAIKKFAGCATRICLVYRDSSPFCSEQCVGDSDCEGDAVCRPLIGDDPPSAELCRGVECYCVRQGDLND